MKKAFKRFKRFINEDSINIYLKLYYRWQLKFKFLKETDSIDDNYVKDIKDYWGQFNLKVSTGWHKWHTSRNGIKDVRYVPEDIYYRYIEPFYNRTEFSDAYTDKALHSMWFPNIKKPIVVAKNINGKYYDDNFNLLSREEVVNNCKKQKHLIIKPTIESGGGRGISFIDSDSAVEMKEKIEDAMTVYRKDFIIQELIDQHPDLKQINPESVNTIRTISFLFKGRVHILSSILRMGVNASRLDNETSGGISCGISKDGKLLKFAYDRFGNIFEKHPQGYVFENNAVPSYDKVLNIIKQEHIKFGHFGLVSWDFSIDESGEPILVEYNVKFQGLNFHQMDNGPLFGDLTDDVLDDVFGGR